MRYPYERFIAFLISRRVDVNEALQRIDLPPVGRMGLVDRKEAVRKTAPAALVRYLAQDYDKRSLIFRDGILKWADTCGFKELWERQKEFGRIVTEPLEAASNIFLNPHARTALGTLLVAKTPEGEIREVLEKEFSFTMSSEALECFKRIFWDLEAMGRKSWEKFVLALHDEQRIVLELGVQGRRPGDILYAIGSEKASTPKQVMQDVLTHSHRQFRQAMATANPAAAGAFKWAQMATQVADKMGRAKILADEAESEIQPVVAGMFSVVVEEAQVLTLDQLEGELAQNRTALDHEMEKLVSETK